MSKFFDSIMDRVVYVRAYRGVADSLSRLTSRELEDIGVDCVATVAHDSAVQEVNAAKARRAEKRAGKVGVSGGRNEMFGASRG